MKLDNQSERILKYIINQNMHNPDLRVSTDDIKRAFPDINPFVISQIFKLLSDYGYIDAIFDDSGYSEGLLLHSGMTYFERKEYDENMQKPNITINNSTGFNIGNNNTIQFSNGFNAEQILDYIKQSSFEDKEALYEVMELLTDCIENNKPLEPTKFQKILSGVKTAAPLITLIGRYIISKIGGQQILG